MFVEYPKDIYWQGGREQPRTVQNWEEEMELNKLGWYEHGKASVAKPQPEPEPEPVTITVVTVEPAAETEAPAEEKPKKKGKK